MELKDLRKLDEHDLKQHSHDYNWSFASCVLSCSTQLLSFGTQGLTTVLVLRGRATQVQRRARMTSCHTWQALDASEVGDVAAAVVSAHAQRVDGRVGARGIDVADGCPSLQCGHA